MVQYDGSGCVFLVVVNIIRGLAEFEILVLCRNYLWKYSADIIVICLLWMLRAVCKHILLRRMSVKV